MTLNIGIIGVGGRLGRCLRQVALAAGCAITLRGCRTGWEIDTEPEVLVDVSHPQALPQVMDYCRTFAIPLVEGVSGLTAQDQAELRLLSEQVPVVQAANFAFGHYLQSELLTRLAELVPGQADGELTVVDRHPTTKKDRPSATAHALANQWEMQSQQPVADIASIRGGLPVSDHEVIFTLPGEHVTVQHAVTDCTAAARGALQAAQWLHKQSPGFWTMTDVFRAESPGRGR